jgi:hypothetical protein
MIPLALLAAIGFQWFLAPLIVSVSLVYAATRHEYMEPILRHAFRFALGIVVFMGIVWAILAIMSWAVSG